MPMTNPDYEEMSNEDIFEIIKVVSEFVQWVMFPEGDPPTTRRDAFISSQRLLVWHDKHKEHGLLLGDDELDATSILQEIDGIWAALPTEPGDTYSQDLDDWAEKQWVRMHGKNADRCDSCGRPLAEEEQDDDCTTCQAKLRTKAQNIAKTGVPTREGI